MGFQGLQSSKRCLHPNKARNIIKMAGSKFCCLPFLCPGKYSPHPSTENIIRGMSSSAACFSTLPISYATFDIPYATEETAEQSDAICFATASPAGLLCGNNPAVGLQAQLFNSLLAHLVFKNFSGGIHGKFRNKANITRGFVLCHMRTHILLKLI